MNKWLYFLSGLVLGAAGGVAAHHFYMVKKLSKYEELAEEYDDIAEEYLRSEDEVNPDKTNTGRESGTMSSKQREEIRNKLQKNWEGTTNYAAMYNNDHPVDSDEDDAPDYYEDSEEEEEETEEMKDLERALDATLDHQANKDKPPKIISYDAVAELPAHIEQCDLFYYKDDGILANEAEEELDPETFIGDALYKYDFADNDETEIYVMNYALDTCYCVTKVNSAFESMKEGE